MCVFCFSKIHACFEIFGVRKRDARLQEARPPRGHAACFSGSLAGNFSVLQHPTYMIA